MKTIISIIIIIVVVWVGYILISRNSLNAPVENTPVTENNGVTATTTGEVKEFTVTGRPFSFSPSTIRVNEGDTVRITFVNEQGTHDWVVDEFNARTSIIQGGQDETIEFVADKTGTFEYYCSVGTHRQQGMFGTLIVE